MSIYYNIPWNTEKNIGKAYNDFMELLPNDEDLACFIDADAMLLTTYFGKQLEDIVAKYPECGLFTCTTNRVKNPAQVVPGMWESNDIAVHREYAEMVAGRDYDKVEILNGDKAGAFSGVMIMIKKSLWKKLGGFKEGMLGVDNDIHIKATEAGEKVYLMKGVYAFHWYRGGDKRDTRHLKKPFTSRKIIYSAITGDYVSKDTAPHYQIPEGWEYRLYSDNPKVNPTHLIEDKLGLGSKKLARHIKLMPWEYFDFDVCVWVDGNTSFDASKIDELAEHDFVISKHPQRDCLYDEAVAIVKYGKDTQENMDRITERYAREGVPKNVGMVASHVIVRKNTEENREFCRRWWEEVQDNSHRDQMSFNYVLWKNPRDIFYIPFRTIFKTHNIHR